MKSRWKRSLFVLSFWWLAAGVSLADQAADEAAIRKSAADYTAAYNKRDGKALAKFWSPEAVYVNPITGDQAVGRPAIEKMFDATLADLKDAKLAVTVDSVKFISPNVAVEHGTARIIRSEKDVEVNNYSAVHVRRDGKWLLDRVTEEESPVAESNYEKLKDLEWMIGHWVDDSNSARVDTLCRWSKNQNFIVRTFTVSVSDRIDTSGVQIVGWDPTKKQIRSWVFDSSGGFGEGLWTKKGRSWHVHALDTAPDGQKATSVNIMTMIDNDKFTWQAVDRHRGGQMLPNIDEMVSPHARPSKRLKSQHGLSKTMKRAVLILTVLAHACGSPHLFVEAYGGGRGGGGGGGGGVAVVVAVGAAALAQGWWRRRSLCGYSGGGYGERGGGGHAAARPSTSAGRVGPEVLATSAPAVLDRVDRATLGAGGARPGAQERWRWWARPGALALRTSEPRRSRQFPKHAGAAPGAPSREC